MIRAVQVVFLHFYKWRRKQVRRVNNVQHCFDLSLVYISLSHINPHSNTYLRNSSFCLSKPATGPQKKASDAQQANTNHRQHATMSLLWNHLLHHDINVVNKMKSPENSCFNHESSHLHRIVVHSCVFSCIPVKHKLPVSQTTNLLAPFHSTQVPFLKCSKMK